MNARHIFLFAAALALTPALPAQAPPRSAPALVPANYNAVTDSLGFPWDVNQYGGINNGASCFSSGFNLLINGNQFNAQQGMMTPDGSEYFHSVNMNGIDVTRRTRIDAKAGYCRFVETLRNSSGAQQTLTVVLQTQFNNRMQSTLTDTGAPSTAQLGAKESGLVFLCPANTGQQVPSVLWMLGSPRGKIRPTVANQQNYRITASYPITLAPGASITLVHAAAQRHLTGGNDAKTLAKLFAPLKSAKLVADIPAKERRLFANFSAAGISGVEGAALASLLENLGVERGATDVLAMGEATRLRGTASCAALEVETRFGKAEIPFERVAAVIGGARDSRVLLRDGQSLSGKLTARGLKFTLTTGTTMELNIAALDRLVLRATPRDATAIAWGFLDTLEGDRIAIQPDASLRFRANTAWGAREIAPEDLVSCGPSEDAPLQFMIELKDGSRFITLLDGDTLAFDTALFGRREFATTAIHRITVVPPKSSDEADAAPPERPSLAIAGGQMLGGQIDLAELHFLSPAGVIPIAPNLIRTLQSTSEDGSENSPIFNAELWGGGTVSGALRETLLPIRSGGAVLRVPTREVMGASVPSPVVPEGLRDKITALVRDLGDPAWEKREAASRELGELGAMARVQLEEAIRQSTDAEVKRRAQALLDTI